MKDLKRVDVPVCDFCGKHVDVIYDAPTTMGSWANMCEDCVKEWGANIKIGHKITRCEENNADKQVKGRRHLNMLDEVIEVTCPLCKDVRDMELDASGTYVCSCGAIVDMGESFI